VWDVFLSYSRGDAERVRPLLDALRAAGLAVFTDEAGVAGFTGISQTIRTELARSRALLAFYSRGYPERQACQWELTTAYLAGLREGDPRRRVMVVNPEADTGHIQPVELRDTRHGTGPVQRIVAEVRAHLARLDGPMGPVGPAEGRGPRWWPGPRPSAAPRFTGRLPELWRVHSALHEHASPLVTGRASATAVQIRGMPGVGKTLLAQEYALRFAAAFPAGVYWLALDGDAAAHARLLAALARALGATATDTATDLYAHFDALGEPFLLVVDGLPGGLTLRQAERLGAPHPLGHTLFTTRSRRYDALATPVELAPLDPGHAAELAGSPDLAEAVGGLPVALTPLAQAVADGHDPRALYATLLGPGASLLDTLAGEEITARLVGEVPQAGPAAMDVLRCGAALHPLPVTVTDAAQALAQADATPRMVAERRAAAGVAELQARSLLTAAPEGRWLLHPVTMHAWRHHDPEPARAEALRRAVLRTLHGAHARATLGDRREREEARMPAAPSESERMAAFDIQVELVTRIGIQELAPDSGSLREALDSLYAFFPFTRTTLRKYSISLADPSAAADAAGPTVRALAYDLLNDTLRPFTSRWHPLLAAHEAQRPQGVSPLDHERAWTDAAAMRACLAELRTPLLRIAGELARISGADFGLSPAS
jgi:hypothetical protein